MKIIIDENKIDEILNRGTEEPNLQRRADGL
jgi:hypothetical protein